MRVRVRVRVCDIPGAVLRHCAREGSERRQRPPIFINVGRYFYYNFFYFSLFLFLRGQRPPIFIKYVYTYVCMNVCMYVRLYDSMYDCMYVCMYVCTYVCMYVCMCVFVCVCVCVCVWWVGVCINWFYQCGQGGRGRRARACHGPRLRVDWRCRPRCVPGLGFRFRFRFRV